MRVDGVNNLNFKYNHPLKKAFDKGLMPEVKRGLLGHELTIKTRSIEHLTPKSQGGGLGWNNVALTDKMANSRRGVKPIEEIVTHEMWIKYLKQFVNVKNYLVDGMVYIKAICRRFKIDLREILND